MRATIDAERSDQALLEVSALTHLFPFGRGGLRRSAQVIRAVEDVSFTVRKSERLGIVGESGSGKSTLARAITGLCRPTSGCVRFDGIDLTTADAAALRRVRARAQLVLQNPLASLDPRMTVWQLVREGLEIHGGADDHARIHEAFEQVGIGSELFNRHPFALSGGQRQRVALARSTVLRPELVVLDEPVSALDLSVQAQILNLLRDLQDTYRLTYVFIVHDLAVARWFCDRIVVMQKGRIVEEADSRELFANPRHPYTRELLDAIPGHMRVGTATGEAI